MAMQIMLPQVEAAKVIAQCGRLRSSAHYCRYFSSNESVAAKQHGDSLTPEDIGQKCIPHSVRLQLASRGLYYCDRMKRLYTQPEMCGRWSYEGTQRNNLYKNARSRALNATPPLHFDKNVMSDVAWGMCPTDFDGAPYAPFGPRLRGPESNTLSIDRIRAINGYVRGNIRFLPLWLNTGLQHFSDQKAHRIVERLLGTRPLLHVFELPVNLHSRARSRVSRARHFARINRINVDQKSFTFEALLFAGLLIDRCPYSGIVFDYLPKCSTGGAIDSPSFMRIDPDGPYNLDNV